MGVRGKGRRALEGVTEEENKGKRGKEMFVKRGKG